MFAPKWICVVCGIIDFLFWCAGWPLGFDIKHGEGNEARPSIVREVITLFGLLMSAAVGLTLAHIESGQVLWLYVTIFAVIALLFMSIMVIILRATMENDANNHHYYDRSSIMISRVILAGMIIFSVSVCGLAALRQLPGQTLFIKPTPAAIESVKSGRLRIGEGKEITGLFAYIRLDRSVYESGVPKQLEMHVFPPVNWKIAYVDWSMPKSKLTDPLRHQTIDGKTQFNRWDLEDLKHDGDYRLQIGLYPTRPIIDLKLAMERLKSRKKFVMFFSRAK